MAPRIPSQGQAVQLPAWINPDLDRLMVVKSADGSYRSWAESLVDLPAGALFARFTGVTATSEPNYSTVQAGQDIHVELNSDLHYANHSCAPTLEFDMERMEVRVSRDRDLKKGDVLSFFYPSTEWAMAQPFDCWCEAGEGKCLRRIEGAGKIDAGKLSKFWLNGYIKDMLREREREGR